LRLLVIIDVGLESIKSNKDSITEGRTGVLLDKAGEYDFVSKHPLIVGWLMNGVSVGEFNSSTCAVIDLGFSSVMTQLIHHQHGAVIEVIAVDGTADVESYFPDYGDLMNDDCGKVVRLSELLDSLPKLYVESKKYTDRVTVRTNKDQIGYLEKIGGGNVSEGARKLIEWAARKKPDLS
jgi:hypothetical protein